MPTNTTSSSSSSASFSPQPPLHSPTTPTSSSMASASNECTASLLSPQDASLRADINRRLLESGDFQKLTVHLTHLLRESGWREQTLQSCTKALRDQDLQITNYAGLYSAVEQDAVSSVDAAVKIDVVRRIREVLEAMLDI